MTWGSSVQPAVFLTKIFDIQSARFTTVTCSQCKYTEIYKAKSNMLGNIFDFFTD